MVYSLSRLHVKDLELTILVTGSQVLGVIGESHVVDTIRPISEAILLLDHRLVDVMGKTDSKN